VDWARLLLSISSAFEPEQPKYRFRSGAHTLRRAEMEDYQSVYLHPKQHVEYYPGAQVIHIKSAVP
jgi:hypothetical protein